jgi:leader peptidase (prepilin peptidase) / N-methyltransferase
MFPSFGLQEALRTPLFEGASLAFGLLVGSFANVCIHRLPGQESVVSPPSRCPSCGARIRPWDNIPLLSYLLLRGRCRSCRAPISLRYPAVEAANGLAYLGLAVRGGPTPQTGVQMILVSALLILSLIDLDHHLLPDAITRPGIALGLAASFLPGSPVKPLAAAAAALGGYVVLFAVARAYRRLRGGEGLGQGDWKMAAMLGAFLGWQKLLLVVLLASLSGTVVGLAFVIFWGRTLRYALPLGTFLGIAGIIVVFAGDPLLAWYGGLFRG